MRIKLLTLVLAGIAFFLGSADLKAGFGRWTVDTESDPFSKGDNVVAGYLSSVRSGVFIECDTAGYGIEVRAVAGWEVTSTELLALEAMDPKAAIAVDGEVLLQDLDTKPGACGQRVACITLTLDSKESEKLLNAFVSAKNQIALRDGISNKPHLLSAKGSTKSAKALLSCTKQQ